MHNAVQEWSMSRSTCEATVEEQRDSSRLSLWRPPDERRHECERSPSVGREWAFATWPYCSALILSTEWRNRRRDTWEWRDRRVRWTLSLRTVHTDRRRISPDKHTYNSRLDDWDQRVHIGHRCHTHSTDRRLETNIEARTCPTDRHRSNDCSSHLKWERSVNTAGERSLDHIDDPTNPRNNGRRRSLCSDIECKRRVRIDSDISTRSEWIECSDSTRRRDDWRAEREKESTDANYPHSPCCSCQWHRFSRCNSSADSSGEWEIKNIDWSSRCNSLWRYKRIDRLQRSAVLVRRLTYSRWQRSPGDHSTLVEEWDWPVGSGIRIDLRNSSADRNRTERIQRRDDWSVPDCKAKVLDCLSASSFRLRDEKEVVRWLLWMVHRWNWSALEGKLVRYERRKISFLSLRARRVHREASQWYFDSNSPSRRRSADAENRNVRHRRSPSIEWRCCTDPRTSSTVRCRDNWNDENSVQPERSFDRTAADQRRPDSRSSHRAFGLQTSRAMWSSPARYRRTFVEDTALDNSRLHRDHQDTSRTRRSVCRCYHMAKIRILRLRQISHRSIHCSKVHRYHCRACRRECRFDGASRRWDTRRAVRWARDIACCGDIVVDVGGSMNSSLKNSRRLREDSRLGRRRDDIWKSVSTNLDIDRAMGDDDSSSRIRDPQLWSNTFRKGTESSETVSRNCFCCRIVPGRIPPSASKWDSHRAPTTADKTDRVVRRNKCNRVEEIHSRLTCDTNDCRRDERVRNGWEPQERNRTNHNQTTVPRSCYPLTRRYTGHRSLRSESYSDRSSSSSSARITSLDVPSILSATDGVHYDIRRSLIHIVRLRMGNSVNSVDRNVLHIEMLDLVNRIWHERRQTVHPTDPDSQHSRDHLPRDLLEYTVRYDIDTRRLRIDWFPWGNKVLHRHPHPDNSPLCHTLRATRDKSTNHLDRTADEHNKEKDSHRSATMTRLFDYGIPFEQYRRKIGTVDRRRTNIDTEHRTKAVYNCRKTHPKIDLNHSDRVDSVRPTRLDWTRLVIPEQWCSCRSVSRSSPWSRVFQWASLRVCLPASQDECNTESIHRPRRTDLDRLCHADEPDKTNSRTRREQRCSLCDPYTEDSIDREKLFLARRAWRK